MDGDMISQLVHVGALDRLMPMHLLLDAAGRVVAHGPTLGRLFDGRTLTGVPFLDLFDLRSPLGLSSPEGFPAVIGQKLRMVARADEPGLRLRGVLMPSGSVTAGNAQGGWIVNLSFGIDLPRAVSALHLTDADFAPTELAMELLYLIDANEAVTGELRGLAQRLDSARRHAREEAETDPLTGLRNRRACDSVLSRLCRDGEAFALMNIDLDFFKAVNDRLGHAAGDYVLGHVAAVMKSVSRAGDCLARVGGDEFVMLLPAATDARAVQAIAERIIAQLTEPIAWNGSECRISASAGFVMVQPDARADPAQLLADADIALYAAKNAGRGRAVQFTAATHVAA